MIEIKNLVKIYKPKKGVPVRAVDGVNLTISDTGMVFILGKSGSGKSTMLNLLGGLDKYDEGEIVIKGKSSKDFSQSEFDSLRNTYVGFIFQEYNILNEFNVGQNIALAMELQGKKATSEALNILLDMVDLTGFAKRKPNELSGGQKQRVAIARALAGDPKVLLCDEATSALDPTTTKGVLQLLKKINKELGITIVIITHEMKVIEQICNRVAILDKAGVAEEGPVEQIFKSPHSKIAKKLIFPDSTAQKFVGGSLIRVVFDGESAGRSVIGEMVLSCGKAVNILAANTKTLDGKAYGQMLLQLPEDGAAAAKMQSFLSSQKIEFIQEEADQNGTDFN